MKKLKSVTILEEIKKKLTFKLIIEAIGWVVIGIIIGTTSGFKVGAIVGAIIGVSYILINVFLQDEVFKKLLDGTFVLAIIIVFPIFIDGLFGSGLLGRIYKNHRFSADTWFSFLGSYLPSMLIGSLTIYQTFIIREKDRQYNELLNRYLFIPYQNTKVYQYSSKDEQIGGWKQSEFVQCLNNGGNSDERSNLLKWWKNGYVIDCSLRNTGKIGIDTVKCTSIEWRINNHEPFLMNEQDRILTAIRSLGDARYTISVFWTFHDDDVITEIKRCMANCVLHVASYTNSFILLKMNIVNDEGETYTIHMKFKMHCIKENELQSVEEHFYPGEI